MKPPTTQLDIKQLCTLSLGSQPGKIRHNNPQSGQGPSEETSLSVEILQLLLVDQIPAVVHDDTFRVLVLALREGITHKDVHGVDSEVARDDRKWRAFVS